MIALRSKRDRELRCRKPIEVYNSLQPHGFGLCSFSQVTNIVVTSIEQRFIYAQEPNVKFMSAIPIQNSCNR
jgi:hypothetical protein